MAPDQDGKGKAPPSVWRIWLFWLNFLVLRGSPPAGAFPINANGFNDPSAIGGLGVDRGGLLRWREAGQPVVAPSRVGLTAARWRDGLRRP
jgi:hypothetical protein